MWQRTLSCVNGTLACLKVIFNVFFLSLHDKYETVMRTPLNNLWLTPRGTRTPG